MVGDMERKIFCLSVERAQRAKTKVHVGPFCAYRNKLASAPANPSGSSLSNRPTDGNGKSDEDLVQSFKAHPGLAALEELLRRYFPMMYNLVRNLCVRHRANWLDPGDVVQNAAIQIMKNIANYDTARVNHQNDNPVWGFLRTITVKRFYFDLRTELRRRRRLRQVPDVARFVEPGTNGPGPHAASGSLRDDQSDNHRETPSEEQATAETQLAHLGQTDRRLPQAVQMKLNGSSHKEIADQLGISVRTVKRLFKRARENWLRPGSTSDHR
jgi:RNA polymerase sigma factor (sigma-70 family)